MDNKAKIDFYLYYKTQLITIIHFLSAKGKLTQKSHL